LSLTKILPPKVQNFANLNEKLSEQKKDIDNLQEKFRLEFKNLANEILERKNQKIYRAKQN